MTHPPLSARLPVAALILLTVSLAACGDDPALHPFFLKQRRPIIFAHRGGGGPEPEATIRTIRNAMAANPEFVIEFDVHRTSDGALVVIHDETVDRTTNGTGRVDKLTLAELRALDAGYCATPNKGNGTSEDGSCQRELNTSLFPFRGAGYKIPTFEEVLDEIPRERFVSIELKASGIESRVAQILRDQNRLEFSIVGAEPDDIAMRLRKALPELPHYLPIGAGTCFALSAKLGLDYAACPEYQAFASPTSGAGLALDTKGMLKAAHARGMAMLYWTINEEPELERIFRLGADGVFTDYPDRAARVLARLRDEGALP